MTLRAPCARWPDMADMLRFDRKGRPTMSVTTKQHTCKNPHKTQLTRRKRTCLNPTLVVVVVVVVRTCVLHECVCPFTCAHASNSGGRTPGSKLPASPPPLPRPDGGGQPWPCAYAQSPKTSCLMQKTPTCNCGISMVRRTMGTRLCVTTRKNGTCRPAQRGHQSPCPRTATAESHWSTKGENHMEQPLRQDRDVDDHRSSQRLLHTCT